MSVRRQEALDYHAPGRPGKIQVAPTTPFRNQHDLSPAYTPGVAEPRRDINGTAVLGLRPVHVLQRGSEVTDIVNRSIIAAVDAQERSRAPRA